MYLDVFCQMIFKVPFLECDLIKNNHQSTYLISYVQWCKYINIAYCTDKNNTKITTNTSFWSYCPYCTNHRIFWGWNSTIPSIFRRLCVYLKGTFKFHSIIIMCFNGFFFNLCRTEDVFLKHWGKQHKETM